MRYDYPTRIDFAVGQPTDPPSSMRSCYLERVITCGYPSLRSSVNLAHSQWPVTPWLACLSLCVFAAIVASRPRANVYLLDLTALCTRPQSRHRQHSRPLHFATLVLSGGRSVPTYYLLLRYRPTSTILRDVFLFPQEAWEAPSEPALMARGISNRYFSDHRSRPRSSNFSIARFVF
ncbi:hypothetical protein J6590_033244 [Homalodisca vitripennis]|nr:hypothetical protein J6590_033244 [Homalodisca vitripennis]